MFLAYLEVQNRQAHVEKLPAKGEVDTSSITEDSVWFVVGVG